MSTLVDLYELIVSDTQVRNRVTKSTPFAKARYTNYAIKNENIIKAVDIILKTKTSAVSYKINYDTDKEMYAITFIFNKKERFMKKHKVCFHMTNFVYDSVRGLEDEYRRNSK